MNVSSCIGTWCLAFLLIGCYTEEPSPTSQSRETLLSGTLLPPSSFRVSSADSAHISFSWKDESIRETGYSLEWSINDNEFTPLLSIPPNQDSLTYLTQLSPDTTYRFRIRSVRENNISDPSEDVRIAHDESYYFLKYSRVDGWLRDGIIQLSEGTAHQILMSSALNAHQYFDIAMHGDSLILIGTFFEVEGLSTLRSAIWHDNRWHRFGEGMPNLFPRSLISAQGEIYVGTAFSRFTQSFVYRWSGSQFSPLTVINLWDGGTIIDGTMLNGNVYMALDFGLRNTSDRTPITVLSYRENNLNTIPQPPAPFLTHYQATGIATHEDAVYLSFLRTSNPENHPTDTTLVTFDGSTWSVADVSPTRRVIHSLTSWRDGLFALRIHLDGSGRESSAEIVQWTASGWNVFRNTGDSYYGLWPTPNGLISGTIEAGTGSAVLEKWNGLTWTELFRSADGELPRKVISRPAWTWTNP